MFLETSSTSDEELKDDDIAIELTKTKPSSSTSKPQVEIQGVENIIDRIEKESLLKDEKYMQKAEMNKQKAEKIDEEEEETELSPEELDAIKQLISPDSLTTERAELEKIKAAMQEEHVEDAVSDVEVEVAVEDKVQQDSTVELSVEDLTASYTEIIEKCEEIDELVATKIKESEEKVEEEARATTKISMGVEQEELEEEVVEVEGTEQDTNEKLEKTVTSLKSKVEKMVEKIEKEMEKTSSKIGDRMHLLDLDQDGILSKEEVAICLQTVLKRKLTLEEAMAIASDMDTDEDGLFTVSEFNKWVDGNKLVKLVEEGREDEVHEVIIAKVERESECVKKETTATK